MTRSLMVDVRAEGIRSSEGLLKDLSEEVLDALPFGVCVFDRDGSILRCNRRAIELWGHTPEKTARYVGAHRLLNADATPLAHSEGPVAQVLRTGEAVRARELIIERPDGRRLVVLGSVYPILTDDNGLDGAVLAFDDITKDTSAESAEHRTRQDLEDFFENGAVALHWVASDGSILRVNQAELDMLGYGREEYVGRHIADFHADKRVIEDILARLTRGERLDKYEARLKAKDGSIKHVLISSNVQFRDGKFLNTRCFTLDVTDLKKAEDALRESEQRLRVTQEAAFAGIGEVDLNGRFLRVNTRFCELTGYSAEELLTRRFSDITHPDDAASEEEQFSDLADGKIERYQSEKRFIRKDGTPIWVELSASLVRDPKGSPLYGVRVAQDITELKRAEDRQKFLLDELNHRVKNMLATVQAVAMQTRRTAPDLSAFSKAFDGRLMALNRVHNLLTRDIGTGALLSDLISETMAPYVAEADRIEMEGPPIRLRAELAVTLTMAVHELVTNAVKYGALAAPSGRIDIRWRVKGAAPSPDRRMIFEWIESGGPAVGAPTRRGFGSNLIERGLAGQLGGEAVLSFEPAGLRCHIVSPLPTSPELEG